GSELWLALGLTHLIVERGMSAPQVSAQQTKLKTLLGPYAPEPVSSWTDVPKPTLERLAREFAEAKRGLAIGGGIGMSGEHATATQIAINLLNFVTGRMGQTIQLDEPLNFPENS